jgi:hypothetical protein
MLVAQLSIFVQDKVGRVAEICGLLGTKKINIVAFDIADTAEGFGILRLVVDDAEAAMDALHAAKVTAKDNAVVCVELTNVPGALGKILRTLSEGGLNVEYLYAGASDRVFIHAIDNDKAAALLASAGYALVQSFGR